MDYILHFKDVLDYDEWLPRYGLLENFNTKILLFGDELDFDL